MQKFYCASPLTPWNGISASEDTNLFSRYFGQINCPMTRTHQTSSPSPEGNLGKDIETAIPSQMILKYPVFPVSSATIDRLQKLQDYLQVRSKLLLDIRSSSLAALSELQMEEALLESAIRMFPN